ncbi:4-(cytidine 5'-diphospho)-2-C-methyl-D-erythritol kinase [Exiguobacterium sp. S17]|nr:4-(cytidine 5'-diphospho)-2-C-methyl-D-erythritol kinase [Exiguobacterium sp. S17]
MNDMRTISVKAPAKINLTLDVLGKRTDGYHEVEMVMTTVDLSDRLELTVLDTDEIRIQSEHAYVPSDHRNLAYRAADLLRKRFGITEGVEIVLDKQIPVAAGLAGGSSDAAATLRGMNELFDLGLTLEELAELGAAVGSDVSFCVMGGTAIARGRGEILETIPSPPPCYVVLAKPKLGVSTADVYRAVQMEKIVHPDTAAMVKAIRERDFDGICANLGNALEGVTLELHPEVRQIKETMLQCGADGVLMSGSGPTVFALIEHEQKANRVYNGLKGFCPEVFVVRILGKKH